MFFKTENIEGIVISHFHRVEINKKRLRLAFQSHKIF
jgi:hypothetical protein